MRLPESGRARSRQTTSPSTSESIDRPSHRIRNISIVGVIAFIVLFALFFEYYVAPRSTPSALFPRVTVSGVVRITQSGLTPVSIDFTSSSGRVNSTQVITTSYVLFLNNGIDYTVTVHWQDAQGHTGTCSAGSYNLNIDGDKTSFDPVCP